MEHAQIKPPSFHSQQRRSKAGGLPPAFWVRIRRLILWTKISAFLPILINISLLDIIWIVFKYHEQIRTRLWILHHRLQQRRKIVSGRVRFQSSQKLRTHSRRHQRQRLRHPSVRKKSSSRHHYIQDRFIDAKTVTSIHNVTPKIGALTIGLGRIHRLTQLTARIFWPDFNYKHRTTNMSLDTRSLLTTLPLDLPTIIKSQPKRPCKECSELKQS